MLQDWRRQDDYEYCHSLTPHWWAWEFLRRNSSYRAAWQRYQAARSAQSSSPKNPALIEQLHEAFNAARDFGLVSFSDPDNPPAGSGRPPTAFPLWWGAVRIAIAGSIAPSARRDAWPGFPYSIALSFEFTKPLEPQLVHAARLLRMCERRVRETTDVRVEVPKIRFDRKRFTLYIRLLDARAAGATIGEIGRAFFRTKADSRGSVKSALRSALKIVEGGYRDLLLMADV